MASLWIHRVLEQPNSGTCQRSQLWCLIFRTQFWRPPKVHSSHSDTWGQTPYGVTSFRMIYFYFILFIYFYLLRLPVSLLLLILLLILIAVITTLPRKCLLGRRFCLTALPLPLSLVGGSYRIFQLISGH